MENQPMTVAYADPPYFGQGKKDYGALHPEAEIWDRKESHWQLQEELMDKFPDGWALSCNPRDLQWIIKYPEQTRIAAWCKTFHQIRPTTVQFAWEPVLWVGGRKDNKRKPMVRDWIANAANQKRGLKGSKPDGFNIWVLDLLNVQEGDTVIDYFTGSRGLKDSVEARGAIWQSRI
jgi:hypothetical protein